MADTSLLGYLVQRVGRAEYLATEALGFVLDRSETCRTTVQELAAKCGAPIGQHLVYRTQVSGDDKAYPDVEGGPAGGDPEVILEGKFSASLTDNQPGTYLKRLGPGRAGILFFVAPARRFIELWPQLRARCAQVGIGAQDIVDDKELKAALLESGHVIAMISWRGLLSRLSAAASAAGEDHVCGDIAQLAGLCELQDSGVFTPLLREEIADLSVARRIRDYYQLPGDIIAKAVQSGFAAKGNLREGFRPPRYTNYFSLGARGAYLSIDPDLWAQHACGPLWFGLQNEFWAVVSRDQWPQMAAQLAALTTGGSDSFESRLTLITRPDGKSIVGIPLPVGVERDRVIDSVVSQLERMHTQLEGWPRSAMTATIGAPTI